MSTTARIMSAGAAALLISCAAAGEEAAFTRRGTSAAVQKQDSARCWRLAQKAKLTDEQATQNLVTGYLIGGVVGVLIVASENEDANKNPRSAHRRQVHDACMEKRGYRRAE